MRRQDNLTWSLCGKGESQEGKGWILFGKLAYHHHLSM